MTYLKLYEGAGVLFRINLVAATPHDGIAVSQNLSAMKALIDATAPSWNSRREWLAGGVANLGFGEMIVPAS